MSVRRINNSSIGDIEWFNEIETKYILEIGHHLVKFIDLTTGVPKVLDGSTVDINGLIYKFDTNESILNPTIADGAVWITIHDDGTNITVGFTDVLIPTYDKIKKGYYGATGERYIAEINKVADDFSALILVDENYIINHSTTELTEKVTNNKNTTASNTNSTASITNSLNNNKTLLWKMTTLVPTKFQSPSSRMGGYFGTSVATSDNYMAVGANNENGSGVDLSGKVYIYNTAGVLQTTLESPNPKAHGYFGYSVAINNNYIIVGAYGENGSGVDISGRVHIYDINGVLQTTIGSPNPETYTSFGYSVSISNNLIVVGAIREYNGVLQYSGNAYIYNTTGVLQTILENPNPEAAGTDGSFGHSVAINNNYIVVGANNEDFSGISNSGRAYIYNTAGVLQATLDSPNPKADGHFGRSVSINDSLTVVGAYGEDVSGISNSGRAYIYDINGTLISTLESPNPETDGGFGRSVSISDSLIIVGSYKEDVSGISNSGRTYIYDINGTLISTLESPNPETDGLLGNSVAISNNLIVVGAYKESGSGVDDSGRAYSCYTVK